MYLLPEEQMNPAAPLEHKDQVTPDAPAPFNYYKSLRSVLLFTIAGIVLYGAATLASDYRSVWAAVKGFPLSTLGLVIALVVSGWILRGWRFHYYLLKSGEQVSPGYSIAVFLSGFALTGTPGKIGEAVKGIFLKRDHNTPMTKVMGIVMVERLMDLWSILILASASLLLFPGWEKLFILCAAVVVGGGAALSLEKIYRPVLMWTGRLSYLRWVSGKALSILLTGKDLMKARIFVVGLVLSTIAWSAESFSLYLIMKGFRLSADVLQANFVYSFSTLIGALSMTPGGIGGAEAGMVGLMGFLGIDYTSGLPAVLLIRICTLWLAILLGIVVMLVMFYVGGEKTRS
jgi:uncharacterized membrane protein YbhN (UPF0104 family)